MQRSNGVRSINQIAMLPYRLNNKKNHVICLSLDSIAKNLELPINSNNSDMSNPDLGNPNFTDYPNYSKFFNSISLFNFAC